MDTQKPSETSTSNFGDISNGHTKAEHEQEQHNDDNNINQVKSEREDGVDSETPSSAAGEQEQEVQSPISKSIDGPTEKDNQQRKKRDGSVDRSVAVNTYFFLYNIKNNSTAELTMSCHY